MKMYPRFCLALALILAVCCSCQHKQGAFQVNQTPHHFKELKEVRTLMADHPDQALLRLKALENDATTREWSEAEQHELRILLTEAQYKTGNLNDHNFSLAPTTALFDSLAALYPKDKTLTFIRANAHYYLGVEHSFQQQDVQAASDFVTALNTAYSLDPSDEDALQTRFFGLCYFRLGEILYDYNIQASALNAFDSAQIYFNKVRDTLGVAACIRSDGEVYQGNKDYERALAKFKEANRMWHFGDEVCDHAIGGMFFEHHQWDSACVYLERSFLTGGPYTRIDAAAKLAEIYRDQGDKEKEDFYTLFYIQNSIRETNRSSDKMEIEFIFDALKEEANAPKPHPAFNSNLFIPILLIVAVIALMAFIIIRNRHRISHIEQQLSTLEKTHREETEGKDLQIRTITQQLDDTKQQLERRSHTANIDLATALSNYLASPVTQKIKKSLEGKDIMTKSVSLYPNLKLSEMDFIEIVKTANTCFPDISTHFLQDYNELSTGDLRHCCLALMGLNDAEIAVMEGITYSGANRRTKRILSVMGSETGLEECILLYLRDLYN